MSHGKQLEIARICSCSKEYVSLILNGHRNQNTDLARNIIRLAERFAHRDRDRNRLMRELESEAIKKEHRIRYNAALRN
jgi:transcriptional regulator with XRE-family HTH domain